MELSRRGSFKLILLFLLRSSCAEGYTTYNRLEEEEEEDEEEEEEVCKYNTVIKSILNYLV
jgi:hypothetical protein